MQYKDKKFLPELKSVGTEIGKNKVEEEIRWLIKQKLFFLETVRNV